MWVHLRRFTRIHLNCRFANTSRELMNARVGLWLGSLNPEKNLQSAHLDRAFRQDILFKSQVQVSTYLS